MVGGSVDKRPQDPGREFTNMRVEAANPDNYGTITLGKVDEADDREGLAETPVVPKSDSSTKTRSTTGRVPSIDNPYAGRIRRACREGATSSPFAIGRPIRRGDDWRRRGLSGPQV